MDDKLNKTEVMWEVEIQESIDLQSSLENKEEEISTGKIAKNIKFESTPKG